MTRFRLRSVLLASMMVFVGLMFVSVPGHRAPMLDAGAHTDHELEPALPSGRHGANSFAHGTGHGTASGVVGPKRYGIFEQRSSTASGYAKVKVNAFMEESRTDFNLEALAIAKVGATEDRDEPPNESGSLYRLKGTVVNPDGTTSTVWYYFPYSEKEHSARAHVPMSFGNSHFSTGRGISDFEGISLAPFSPLVPGSGKRVRVGGTALHTK